MASLGGHGFQGAHVLMVTSGQVPASAGLLSFALCLACIDYTCKALFGHGPGSSYSCYVRG